MADTHKQRLAEHRLIAWANSYDGDIRIEPEKSDARAVLAELVGVRARLDTAEKALRRIAYMTFDVNVEPADDLRDCKAIAAAAFCVEGTEPA